MDVCQRIKQIHSGRYMIWEDGVSDYGVDHYNENYRRTPCGGNPDPVKDDGVKPIPRITIQHAIDKRVLAEIEDDRAQAELIKALRNLAVVERAVRRNA